MFNAGLHPELRRGAGISLVKPFDDLRVSPSAGPEYEAFPTPPLHDESEEVCVRDDLATRPTCGQEGVDEGEAPIVGAVEYVLQYEGRPLV